jgi:hypothetical protein
MEDGMSKNIILEQSGNVTKKAILQDDGSFLMIVEVGGMNAVVASMILKPESVRKLARVLEGAL